MLLLVESEAMVRMFQHIVLICIGGLFIYLGIKKRFEPFLLLPIGLGIILTNIPGAGMMDEGGLFFYLKKYLIDTEILPPLIFMGIGAMTDFTPLLAYPRSILLGAATQGGVFIVLLIAIILGFKVPEACSIGIIGGATGPVTILTTTRLAPHILPAVALAGYSYMALVPIIQPPIIRALTTPEERKIEMRPLRQVSQAEKIIFPVLVTVVCALIAPIITPLIGMFMMGNLLRESGVVDRLAKTAQSQMIDVLTIFIGLIVGGMLTAEVFFTKATMLILLLGAVAFATATACGLIAGKIMCKLSGGQLNPMLGAAGVSAVPMAARIVHVMGQKENPRNFLLMHAMGPNVAGAIGAAMAAGVFMTLI
jgi:oxaloacetate decarboxylase beta subunit